MRKYIDWKLKLIIETNEILNFDINLNKINTINKIH